MRVNFVFNPRHIKINTINMCSRNQSLKHQVGKNKDLVRIQDVKD